VRVVEQVAVKVKTDKLTPESLADFSVVVMVDAALEDCIEYGRPLFGALSAPCLFFSRSDFRAATVAPL